MYLLTTTVTVLTDRLTLCSQWKKHAVRGSFYQSGCRQKINDLLKPRNRGGLNERTVYKDAWKVGKVKVNQQGMIQHNRTSNGREISPP